MLVGNFAAAGGLLGMGIFTEAGTEAGAESTARAIDEEFERNRILHAKGITPVPAREKTKGSLFNVKAFVITGIIGAAIGVALAPVIGSGLVTMFGLQAGAELAASIITCATVAAVSYAPSIHIYKSIARGTNWLYEKSYSGSQPHTPVEVHEPVIVVQPAMHQKITAEDYAKLNERLNTDRKNFADAISTQIQTAATTSLTTGM
jgi:hypothetical protein